MDARLPAKQPEGSEGAQMTYHQKRYRHEPGFREKELARARETYAKSDAIRKRRMYLSSTVSRLHESIATKRRQIKDMQAMIAHLNSEKEQCKWMIYQQKLARASRDGV